MTRRLVVADENHAFVASHVTEPWWWRCPYCDLTTQMGAVGLRTHVYLCHPGQPTRGIPLKEYQCPIRDWSSTASKQPLMAASS